MTVKLKVFASGYCKQSRYLAMRDEPREPGRFYAMWALLEHPKAGYVLFDTGYSRRYFEGTQRLPYSLYAALTPVTLPEDGAAAVEQLISLGVAPQDISSIVVSHFHADHVGGLKDFPDARFVCSSAAYRAVKGKRGFAAVSRAFLPGLIPEDFERRCHFIEDDDLKHLPSCYMPFDRGVDLFGDGSVWVVPLDGHATGQIGLLVKTYAGERFLVADAAWHRRAVRERVLPHPVVRLIVSSWSKYIETFDKVRVFHKNRPDVVLIPSHCAETYTTCVVEKSV